MIMSDLNSLSIADAHARMIAGVLSPSELLEAHIERIEAENDTINAFEHLCF